MPDSSIERVTSAKLLGIYIQNNLKCDIHFKHIMTNLAKDYSKDEVSV